MLANWQNASAAGHFSATHWSIVLAAAKDGPEAGLALEDLCRAYWFPLYAFVRRQGESPHDAQDLTQAFFERFLERDYLRDVHPDKGRFRSFLLASLKHFLSHERERARAIKRGGNRIFVPIDPDFAETHYAAEAVESLTPEKIFERKWAMTLLERATRRLQEEYVSENKGQVFEQLKATLTEPRGTIPYSTFATTLGMSEGAVRMAVHRLRQHYRRILRFEIAQTVSRPEDVEIEIRHVVESLSSS